MRKRINIKLDINSIIEFEMSENERLELVKYILYECTSTKGLTTFTKEFINDIYDSEMEFENRGEVLDACRLLMKNM